MERALCAIPLGKKNWLFTSSEVGAQRVGIIQSLLVTCRLHEVDAYTYLVDVLQRISVHPASRAIELTPRMWKSLFADDPLRSDLGQRQRQHDPPPRPILPAYAAASATYLGGDPPGSERPVAAALRAGALRSESRRGRGGVPGRRALASDADRPWA